MAFKTKQDPHSPEAPGEAQVVGNPAPWPPREGLPLALAWIGGVVAGWIAVEAFWTFYYPAGRPTVADQWTAMRFICFSSTAVGAWQGWLLFREWWRWIAWTCIAAVGAWPWVDPVGPWVVVTLTHLLAALQCCLFIGVRARPWLWLPIAIGLPPLTLFSMNYFGGALSDWTKPVAAMLHLPPLFSSGIPTGIILSASIIIYAAALAWCMPLFKCANGNEVGNAAAREVERETDSEYL
jgi:hypothetical protein